MRTKESCKNCGNEECPEEAESSHIDYCCFYRPNRAMIVERYVVAEEALAKARTALTKIRFQSTEEAIVCLAMGVLKGVKEE